ncbi:MAG TPA: hypothetical protein VEW46_02355 [Pyrinomonadaceae bacterium]|nr:hypothetical protein [Pyrinomonadaceae bacterium]
MIKHYMNGLLFFGGGRELCVVASDVSRTSALLHVRGLGLLPISFFITFDGFLTVGKFGTMLVSFLKDGLTFASASQSIKTYRPLASNQLVAGCRTRWRGVCDRVWYIKTPTDPKDGRGI